MCVECVLQLQYVAVCTIGDMVCLHVVGLSALLYLLHQ